MDAQRQKIEMSRSLTLAVHSGTSSEKQGKSNEFLSSNQSGNSKLAFGNRLVDDFESSNEDHSAMLFALAHPDVRVPKGLNALDV